MCLAVINIVKSGFLKHDCRVNCQNVDVLIHYLEMTEQILIMWVPIGGICAWLVAFAVQKCKRNFSNNKTAKIRD